MTSEVEQVWARCAGCGRRVRRWRLSKLFLDPRSDRRTLAGNGLETALDAGHRTPRAAGLALQEEQSGVLLQDGLRRAAGLTGHVLLDVFLKYTFDLLRLETALDDQLVVRVHRAARTQLGQQERLHVLRLPMQPGGGRCGGEEEQRDSWLVMTFTCQNGDDESQNKHYSRFAHVDEVGERRLLGAHS